MRKTTTTLLLFAVPLLTFCQGFEYKVASDLKAAKLGTITFSETSDQWIELTQTAYPAHHEVEGYAKRLRNNQRFNQNLNKLHKNQYISTPESVKPDSILTFNGLPIGGAGIPNDNNMAISNEGMIVSVINSNVSIFKSDGSFIRYRTLRSIVNEMLPNLDRTYDPKVLYDPVADKFMLIFLQGSTSADSRIVVGFTQTNNPDGIWNFYAIEGNPFTGKTWSDYPIVAMNKEDLYITVNILRDNESWQEGFTQSVVWQINKKDGYAGDTLTQRLYYDLTYNGQPIWSICPLLQTPETDDKGIYMLSVRPSAVANDTLFIHRITGTAKSTQQSYSLQVAKADKTYGVPPSAFQAAQGFRLQTNDTRVLSGYRHLGHIQYVQSSYIPTNHAAGLYHGLITNLNNPEVKTQYITHDTFDMAYPSIACMADASNQFASVITASYSSPFHFPGTLALYHTKALSLPSLYSHPVIIKAGLGLINTFLPDSIERWGDYTAIQSKYNQPGHAWLSGSYGMQNARNGVWIGEIKTQDELQLEVVDAGMRIAPNPNSGIFQLTVNVSNNERLIFSCMSAEGKQVRTDFEAMLYKGENQLTLNLAGISPGIYIIRARNKTNKVVYSQKLMIR